jgi:hypothetical protein
MANGERYPHPLQITEGPSHSCGCQGERHQAIVETPFIFMATRRLIITVGEYSSKQSTGTSREKNSIYFIGVRQRHTFPIPMADPYIDSRTDLCPSARTATISGLIAGLGGWYGTEYEVRTPQLESHWLWRMKLSLRKQYHEARSGLHETCVAEFENT